MIHRYKRPVGWRGESHRHYLASKGVKTTTKINYKKGSFLDFSRPARKVEYELIRPESHVKTPVREGDSAKVGFQVNREGIKGEWMWVKVKGYDEKEGWYYGTLQNDPAYAKGLKFGDEVYFKQENVLKAMDSATQKRGEAYLNKVAKMKIPDEKKSKMMSEYEKKNLKGYELYAKKDDSYARWRKLVNMSPGELERFKSSPEGKVAGLSRKEASAVGIKSGRDSASAIIRMKRKPRSEWSETDEEWMRRQVSFVSRMKGNPGKLYDEKGRPTRKLLALKIWGHDPEKSR